MKRFGSLFWPRNPRAWRPVAWIWTALAGFNTFITADVAAHEPAFRSVFVVFAAVTWLCVWQLWRLVWAQELETP